MFGWVGRSGRRKSAIAQLQAGEVDPRVVFTGLPPDERDAVFTAATKQLLFHGATPVAGRIADARLEVGPETEASLVAADDVFAELGDFARCVTVCEQLVILTDEAVRHVVRLATRLVGVGTPDEALEVLDMLKVSNGNWVDIAPVRAEALAALDRPQEAIAILGELLAHDQLVMRSSLDTFGWQVANNRTERVRPLYDALIAETEGAEQVVVAAMRSGRLDPRSAVNFRLLADSLMVDSAYVPRDVALEEPQVTLTASYDERDPWSVSRFAAAKLRCGAIREANRLFERARDLDGRCFAAYRGLAGASSVQRTRTFDRVHSLPKPPVPSGIEGVVVDWPALTEVEQRIVAASLHPLRSFLPPLRDADARVALLPIDVRTVDLPAFGGLSDVAFDDHRRFAALQGVASAHERLATSRIEDLLAFGDDGGLVFDANLCHIRERARMTSCSRVSIAPPVRVAMGLLILGVCMLSGAPAAAQSSFVDGERVRLRAHFDEVIAELEAADTSALTEEQQANRAVLLVRLAAYRDRGVFPLRYGGPDGLAPEFRDVHGTRCAMGELIYLSGETELVEDVATTANSATIAELSADPRLVQWLHDNGLSLEEAGRIQPAYSPWRATDCLCVGSTSLWRGEVRGSTEGDRWAESESGYNEYTADVELIEPLRGSDGRSAGQQATVAIWFHAGPGQPVLVAFDADNRGWAFPTDEAFELVACAIEYPAYNAPQLVTCGNPVVVDLDAALDTMELSAGQCEAALDTQEDLAPCPKDDGCSVGAPGRADGNPLGPLALLTMLALIAARRCRERAAP